MAMNDPLGDMIARIHNAQMRNKSKVSTPASRLRVSVLDVLKTEGFIRGYAAVEHSNGRKELETELKYSDGAAGLRLGQGASAREQRIGRCDPVDTQGCDGRSRRARQQRGRRDSLHRLLI